MSPWPLLSRVLLSLALVVNAVAPIAASTRMPGPSGPQATAAAHAHAMSQTVPCHQQRHAQAMSADAPPVALPTPGDSTQPGPDSCAAGTCACACVHPGHGALPAIVAALEPARQGVLIGALPLAHREPALRHPIRPPIG